MLSLLRSTKYIRSLSLIRDSGSKFVSKTSSVDTFTNNVLMRSYATLRQTKNLAPIEKLTFEVRRSGKINKRNIDEVFTEIKHKNNITSTQSLTVIQCCGQLLHEELPEQKTRLVQQIWEVLNKRGVQLDVSHYNALLKVYLDNEHTFSPSKFLEDMELKGIQPNKVTYQRIIWRYCHTGDLETAIKILNKMKDLDMPVSESVMNAFVMGHAFNGDIDGAKGIIETMEGGGLNASNTTYTLLACGYARKGDMSGIEQVLATAKNKDISLTDGDLLHVIKNLALGGHEDKVEQIISQLQKVRGYNQEAILIVYDLLNKGCESTARKLLATMNVSDSSTSKEYKGGFYVKYLVKLDKPADQLIETIRELQNDNLVPGAIFAATKASLDIGKSELALRLFKELQKDGYQIREHYYWPLLARKCLENDEEGLLEIIRNMVNNNINQLLSTDTLKPFVLQYLLKKHSPQNAVTKLEIAGIPAIHAGRVVFQMLLEAKNIESAANIAIRYPPYGQLQYIRGHLLNALEKTKDVKSFTQILHVIFSNPEKLIKNSQPDDINISNQIGGIIEKAINIIDSGDLAEKLLAAALSKGLKIDIASAKNIEECLGSKLTPQISKILEQLTSPDLIITPLEIQSKRKTRQLPMTPSQIENLIESEENKDSDTNGLYNKLINAYIDEGDVDKVTDFLKKLKPNFELKVITMIKLYNLYCENGLVDKANEIRAQFDTRNYEFVLNNEKIILMAYALVKSNRYDDAIKYLKENKPSAPENKYIINNNTQKMLEILVEQKDEAKVKEMYEIILETYLKPNNIVLGPLINLYLSKDDIDEALKQFEHCCMQYKATPMSKKLMKILIDKEDAERLQWMANVCAQVHGEVNVLHDMVFAFVECGRVVQARRILQTPALYVQYSRFEKYCKYYANKNEPLYMERLLEATKDLPSFDRTKIFQHLLVVYCNTNATDKALDLWYQMQDDCQVPNNEFLILLAEHLKKNNIEVPFVIPSKKKQNVKQNV